MFIGHHALALVSRRIDKSPSLGLMFIAVQFLDLLWSVFVLLGIETVQIDIGHTKLSPLNFISFPYSHGLLMSLVWSMLFGWFYFIITKNKKGAVLLLVLVFSHWMLDFFTHSSDMVIAPFGNAKAGLGLWNYPMMESTIEIGLFIAGIYLYLKSGKLIRKTSFWMMIVFLLIIQFSSIFSPPPPTANAVALAANVYWLMALWAWCTEKPTIQK